MGFQRSCLVLAALFCSVVLVPQALHAQPPVATAPDAVRPTSEDLFRLQATLRSLPVVGGELLLSAPSRSSGSERAQSAAAAPTPGVARQRTATIAQEYLDGLMRAPELQMSADGSLVGNPSVYVLTLFNDVSVRLAKRDMQRDSLGHDVWRGALIGDEGGEATLVIDKGRITGKVRIGAKTYGIQPGADDTHDVIEYDEKTLPVVDDDRRSPRQLPPAAPREETTPPSFAPQVFNPSSPVERQQSERPQAVSSATLTIMVVYTPRALALRPNITSDISLFVSNLNTALTNSSTNVTVNLVGTQQVNYTESASTTMSDMLDDATNGVGDFARIAQMRGALQADLVQVWGVPSDACGLAWINDYYDTEGNNLGYDASNTTSVVAIDSRGSCINSAYDAASHEVGHNLGAQHDRYTQNLRGSKNTAGPQGYNYGYIDLTAHFSDLMAYGSQSSGSNLCNDQNVSCPHIPYFSNPNVTYNGRPTGVADILPTAADNARRINEIAPYVAQMDSFLQQPKLGIFITGGGGASTITSSTGLSCSATCTNNTFAAGQTITLTATPATGWTFAGWGSGSCITQTSASTGGTCTVVMNGWGYVQPSFIQGAARQSLTVTRGGFGGGTVTSSPSGINCGATCTASFSAGTVVTLAATANAGSSFVGWSNGCTGTGTCAVTLNAAQNVTATFNLTASTAQTLSVSVSGTGAVTSAPAGISCGAVCTATFTAGTPVTLTPTPGANVTFAGWGGACSGTGICTVTMNAATSVTAAFSNIQGAQSVTLGSIYSSTQSAIQSYLRFNNTGATAGAAQVTLSSDSTGIALGQWTSPLIPAGASRQFSVADIESGTGQLFTKPNSYSVKVQPQMSGYLQHVLYRPSDGTLTNLSTCDTGVTANAKQLVNVHTSRLDYGFPSSVVVSNTGASTVSVALGLYDAITGAKLGTGNYTVAGVVSGAQVEVKVATMEAALGFSPDTSGIVHYVVKAESDFTGFLQHLVNNLQVGVITDMTTVCSLTALPTTFASPVRMSSAYSSSQGAIQSYLRFYNTGASAGTVGVDLAADADGRVLAQWTSPSIAAGASRQFSVEEIERGAGFTGTKPPRYGVVIRPQIGGYVQHVLYRPSDGTLTNLSTCDSGVSVSAKQLINVHSSVLDYGFPSLVVVNNTGASATSVSLGVYNAVTGARLGTGTYTTPSVPAGGHVRVAVSVMEGALGLARNADIVHYVIKAESTFTGFLQHLVNNIQVGVITDMTTMCALNNDDAAPDGVGTNGVIAVGTPIKGKLDFAGDTDWYKIVSAPGIRYHVDLQGASSSSGTLVDPILNLRNAVGTVIATANDTGLGLDAAMDFTETASTAQTYFLEATASQNGTGTYRLSAARDDVLPDSVDTNGSASLGTAVNGTINWAGDRDWFRVSLTAGQSYVVDLLGASSDHGTLVDPYLRIMNAAGTQVASNDDSASGCCDSQITYTPTTSGNYYLVAGSVGDVGSGTYQLLAQQSAQAVATITPLAIRGTSNFSVTYGVSATMKVDSIVNTSTTRNSGTLRLELWYLRAPYTGVSAQGYKLAQASLGTLNAGRTLSFVNQTAATLTTPPAGTYYPVFLLTEYNPGSCSEAAGFCTATYVNMTPTQQVR